MKRLSIITCIIIALLGFSSNAQAQNLKDAGQYVSYIGTQYNEINKEYLSYTSAVAHSKTARKIDARRKALLLQVKDASRKIAAMPAFQGDKSYRDSTVAFLKLSSLILNDDYAKIVNMEEVAEQSYDAMEAYLLAQDLANAKSNKMFKNLVAAQRSFAAKHNVKLIEEGNDVDKKMEIAAQVSAYHKIVYLTFFKSFKQEVYLMEAFQKKDINAIEQNNKTLQKYAAEATAKLDTMKAFKNDRSLVLACKQLQDFYKTETAETAALVDFLLKEENFQKIKKAMESKKPAQRTQADIDQYNQAIADINKASNTYNAINTKLNNGRSKTLHNWNKVSQAFLAKHTPKYK